LSASGLGVNDAGLNTHLLACVEAAAQPGQPQLLYAALDRALAAIVGHRLFTMMVIDADGLKVRRVYSNQPAAYPVGGFKTHRQTPWGQQVLAAGKPYIGHNADDIRWAFADHALIFSLGCESVLNVPVRYDGRVIGTTNLLDIAGRYRPEHVAMIQPFCALLVPVFLREIGS
jgi:GAF domain-containing protein